MPTENSAIAFHETRLSRLDDEVAEHGAQLAEHRADQRAVIDKLDTVSDKVDLVLAKLDAQDDRITELESCVAASKKRGAFVRKYWSHAVLAALGAGGTYLGKLVAVWLAGAHH